MSAWKQPISLVLSIAVFNADAVIAWAAGVMFGIVAYGVLGLPLWLAAVMALVVVLGVWFVSAPLCGPWMMCWSGRIRNWGRPAPVRHVPAPVDALAALLEPVTGRSVPAPQSRSTEPRPLESYELGTWECPWCERPAVSGTHHWDDRGPYQLLSNHALECPSGHRWTNSTDGG
ncbi:hypothetical protein [Streptomyces sp. CT34]|uniref:hypothetical protein n=1 Tax=Streptomyces sp. CT34 TaxID=1553907 RepID=UPI0012FEA609|nr:hypothetical protein [Streptomyces sp. CT34]